MQKSSFDYTLSEYERFALQGRINLSDGHARIPLSQRQKDIVGRALALFEQAATRHQKEVEQEFLRNFSACVSQSLPAYDYPSLLTFSSSAAIKKIAQVCRLRGFRVHLIEPCFDNIFYLLRSEEVQVESLAETELLEASVLSRLGPTDVLWLVQPNNPTGFCLSSQEFSCLVGYAFKYGFALVIDFCFRIYARHLATWDQYAELRDSGVTYVCIEDTGKTWSIGDTKVGVSSCSSDIWPLLYRLHDELLLNVSPWHLSIINEFIKDSLDHGIQETILRHVHRNRERVHELIKKSLVRRASAWSDNVPMELLELNTGASAEAFWGELREGGVDILPASNYMWSGSNSYRSRFRIPLARSFSDIDRAIPIIELAINRVGSS